MKPAIYLPSDALKPFVRHYLIVESADGTNNLILPDTSITLVFRLRGSISFSERGVTHAIDPFSVTGLRKVPRTVQYQPHSSTLLVILKEGGASTLLGKPANELFGLSLCLDHFMPRNELDEVSELLAEAPTDNDKIILLEQFLTRMLKHPVEDALVKEALQRIHNARGIMNVHSLSAQLNISQDAFEKRFRAFTGTSPKQFSSIVRLRSAISQWNKTVDLTALAYDSGYFDQAHFNHAFKSFTGLAPREFFAMKEVW